MEISQSHRALRRHATALDVAVACAWDELAFRRRILAVCGFDERSALALALRLDLGLARPLELVGAGCPPAVAARILL